jgi:hypothetical protein
VLFTPKKRRPRGKKAFLICVYRGMKLKFVSCWKTSGNLHSINLEVFDEGVWFRYLSFWQLREKNVFRSKMLFSRGEVEMRLRKVRKKVG